MREKAARGLTSYCWDNRQEKPPAVLGSFSERSMKYMGELTKNHSTVTPVNFFVQIFSTSNGKVRIMS